LDAEMAVVGLLEEEFIFHTNNKQIYTPQGNTNVKAIMAINVGGLLLLHIIN